MSVEAELMVSSVSTEAVVLSEPDLGRIEVGSQARMFSRAMFKILHQFSRSSRVSAIKRCLIVVTPRFRSCKINCAVKKL